MEKELIELDKYAVKAALYSLHRQRGNGLGFERSAESIVNPSSV
jgi:hypothetical protein